MTENISQEVESIPVDEITHDQSQRENEKELFKKEPRVNVISKEAMEERVQKVFHLLWQTLSRSFGPYGAPTMIMNYPYQHVTKDGFTIMKNLSMDSSDQLVDQSIANMASDICGRLNYAVGDGTTSAVVATNSIYQNYLKYKPMFENMLVMPRDIIRVLNEAREVLVNNLKQIALPIQSDDMDVLYQNIYRVVYISSNGDEEIADYVASLYKELGFPGVNCELSQDGKTRMRLITGYKYNLILNDKLYINSDNDTMQVTGADVVILSVKVTKSVYQNILVPLNEQSRIRGRKLIVCASSYDETALGQTIRRDLMQEYGKTKEINMVLCTYRSVSDHLRKMCSDFATLCNTVVIDRELKSMIEGELANGKTILEIFNMDDRDEIPNMVKMKNLNGTPVRVNFDDPDSKDKLEPIFENHSLRLGYVGKAELGIKDSIFTDFYYNEGQYQATLKDAETELSDAVTKYSKMGSFNLVVSQAQERLYALKLKMGTIEVGGNSELSQKMLKDAVDDSVKAAASAFNHGVVLGCNLSLISIINAGLSRMMQNKPDDKLAITILSILREGFMDTYRTVLANAFRDEVMILPNEDNPEEYLDLVLMRSTRFFGKNIFENDAHEIPNLTGVIESCKKRNEDGSCRLHDLIIMFSTVTNQVFDVTTRTFTKDIINSSQTDEEILTATVDLLGLLITGNQMIVTQKHNF